MEALDQAVGPSLRAHFAALPDPRSERTKRHQWLDLLTIASCARLCGADSWVDVELFGPASCPGTAWAPGLAAHLPGAAQRHALA